MHDTKSTAWSGDKQEQQRIRRASRGSSSGGHSGAEEQEQSACPQPTINVLCHLGRVAHAKLTQPNEHERNDALGTSVQGTFAISLIILASERLGQVAS